MKTILTDRCYLMPLLFIWLGLRSLWTSYGEWQEGAPFITWVDASAGGFFLAFATQRVLERRLASREGRDPSIARAGDTPQ